VGGGGERERARERECESKSEEICRCPFSGPPPLPLPPPHWERMESSEVHCGVQCIVLVILMNLTKKKKATDGYSVKYVFKGMEPLLLQPLYN
jgi:hypothetical protein